MLKKFMITAFLIILAVAFWLVMKNNRPAEVVHYGFPADENYSEITNEDWKTFSDVEAGFTVKYPADWMLEDSGGNQLIRANIAKDNSVGMQILMFKDKTYDFDKFVLEYLDSFQNDMLLNWDGNIQQFSSKSSYNKYINFNRTAFYFTRENGEQWYLIEYIWKKEETVIAFQSGIAADLVSEFETILDEIANSLKFVGK